MEPYYESPLAVLYVGDCQEVLPSLDKGSVDLLATDPPYGVNWQSGNRKVSGAFDRITGDDGTIDVPSVLALAMRALRPFRHVYVFGFSAADLTDALSLSATADLVWDKGQPGMGNLELPFAPSHERLTFGVHVKSEANRKRGDGRLSARLRQGSVLRVPRVNATAVTRHPTEKPVALMQQLIEASSLVGETVLDPFCGAGSTAVAAVLSGRKAVGVEIDERYAAISVERIKVAERIAAEMRAA